MKSIYITRPGKLVRKENTLYFVSKESGKRPIAVENVSDIYALAPLSVSSQVLHLLSKKGIPLHFFDVYGNYDGTYYPRSTRVSGELVLRQAEHHLNEEKRLFLAKQFVNGSIRNANRTLLKYGLEKIDVRCEGEAEKLMGCEGYFRELYYERLDAILGEDFKIGKRTRKPPSNRGNALLSFGNALLYSTIVSEIYRTPLHPGISYLHKPFERRFSLALDIAEIFKPFLVDRLIVYLVNKRILKPHHFREELGGILLNDEGKRIFLKYWSERLSTTIKHRKLKRNVSYRRLIRLELQKLSKHLLGISKYEPFVVWW